MASSGGHWRTCGDTRGHDIKSVRDREARFKSRAPDQLLNSQSSFTAVDFASVTGPSLSLWRPALLRRLNPSDALHEDPGSTPLTSPPPE